LYSLAKVASVVVASLLFSLRTFSVSSYAITGLPGTSTDNTIQSPISENNSNQATENVIAYNTSVADIPGIASGSGSDGLTVGNILFGCDDIVNRGDTVSVQAKPGCDIVIRYIVNYCLSHMNEAMAIENKQICWDNAMDSGLKYAVKWLDGGTSVMLKAQSDIMAMKANVLATLPKETLLSQCEAKQGFKFPPSTADLMMKMPIEKLRTLCG
jgi:hypothetical protein